jgi:hypothetical protein
MLKVLAIGNLVLVLACGYGLFSINDTFNNRIAEMESAMEQSQSAAEKRLTNVSSDVALINDRVGVTAVELKAARDAAQTLRQQQERAERELANQLASKANSTDVEVLREEATTKLTALQEDSNAKIGTVAGEVTGVRQELTATREDLDRRLVDVKNVLSEGIARNSGELAELRKKGERDYFEFDIRKNSKQPLQRVADIQMGVTKTDAKKGKYTAIVQVDDSRLEKKDRTVNEPMQFLVGRDQLRYEIVVNSVEKDRIRGYVSVPKDKVLAAENARPRLQ